MSGGTVKPAMTPEEWADGLGHSDSDATFYYRSVLIRGSFHARHEKDGLSLAASTSISGDPDFLDASDRHALAALALHAQPFGFTHEDVWLLRSMAHHAHIDTYGGTSSDGSLLAETVELRNLADRIEALLPPATPGA